MSGTEMEFLKMRLDEDAAALRNGDPCDPVRAMRDVAVWRRLLLEYSIPPGTDAVYGGTERETGFRLALSFALKAKIATYDGNPVTGEPFPSGQRKADDPTAGRNGSS